jgi:Asparagine synthase
MSWIFGEIVKNKNSVSDLSKIINDEILNSFSNKNVNIVSGGNSRNLFFIKNSNKNIFIAGIGIENNDGINRIIDKVGWEAVLSKGIEKTLNLDGHFVIIVVEDLKVEIYTDKLGLRDIYIRELDDRIIFSTKIKLLTYFGALEINFTEFSSRWLLFNQISQESVFKNCTRLIAGKSANIDIADNYKVTYGSNNLEFSENPFDSLEYEFRLTSLVNLNVSASEQLSLSLSGGMDSRVILSILLGNRKEFFETHSFGEPSHPDSMLAKEITEKFNIQHLQYNSTINNIDNLINEIENYTTETVVNNAASAIMQLGNYKSLSEGNLVIVDGGFGEIWRREFFLKLLVTGKKALLSGKSEEIIPYLTMPRADMFSDDIMKEMRQGVINQVESLYETLPQINKNNIENWLDQFALKTRLPNYFAHEQIRLDDMVTAVMPFVQQSLITNLFGVEISEKKNGRLFRKMIKKNYPKLAEFSLVKGTTKQPYKLNSLQARLWSLMIKKLGKNYKEVSNTDILLKMLKEYIVDTVHSISITETAIYDKTKIQNLVMNHYNGNQPNGYSVDWLLSFLLFNKSISKF